MKAERKKENSLGIEDPLRKRGGVIQVTQYLIQDKLLTGHADPRTARGTFPGNTGRKQRGDRATQMSVKMPRGSLTGLAAPSPLPRRYNLHTHIQQSNPQPLQMAHPPIRPRETGK